MIQLILIPLIFLQSCTFSVTSTDITGNTGPVTETDSTTQEPTNETDISPHFTFPEDLPKLLPPFMV